MVNRVTDNLLHNQAVHNVHRVRAKQIANQEKSISMKRVNHPSDDPLAAAQVLRYRNLSRNTEQYQKNASTALNLLGTADRALEGATEILIRSKELAIGQASSASATPDTRKAIASEIKELKAQMINIANTRFADRYIFGGYQTQKNPFMGDGTYKGDHGNIPLEIKENYYIAPNIPGSIPFLGYKQKGGVNLFTIFDTMIKGLETNNQKIIQDTLELFDQAQSQVFMGRATVGSRVNSIEATKRVMDGDHVETAKLISDTEDADLVDIFTNMKRDMNVLERTMKTSTQLIGPSLFDYIDR